MCFTSKTTVDSSGTQTSTATPEERELMALQVAAQKEIQPQQLGVQKTGLELVNKLLAGETNLPGFFGQIGAGISEDITSEISQKAVSDILPSFQSSGILDSGVAASVAARTAGDIRRASEEFNIGNKLNLLNLALSGQAQVQQPILYQSNQLASQLAGLRTTTTTGTQTTTSPWMTGSNILNAAGTGLGMWAALK